MSDQPATYHLYLDDSGSRHPDHRPDLNRADAMDWFALGGVLVHTDDLRAAVDMHGGFMDRWGLTAPLHSTEIRGKRKNFRWLGRDQQRATMFYDELTAMLVGLPVLGFACVVDRPGYNARYAKAYGNNRWMMCRTAFSIVVERAVKRVRAEGARLEVFFEQCGEREDRDIIGYARGMKQDGMPFDEKNSASYGALSPAEFRESLLGEPQRRTKNSALIQIADLYLYPMLKGGYEPDYRPYRDLLEAKRIIDAHLSQEERGGLGIKYSCFDLQNKKGPG